MRLQRRHDARPIGDPARVERLQQTKLDHPRRLLDANVHDVWPKAGPDLGNGLVVGAERRLLDLEARVGLLEAADRLRHQTVLVGEDLQRAGELGGLCPAGLRRRRALVRRSRRRAGRGRPAPSPATSRPRVWMMRAQVFMAIPQSCRWLESEALHGERGTPRRSPPGGSPEARVVPAVHGRHRQVAQTFHRLQVCVDVAARHLVEQRSVAVHGVAREEDAALLLPQADAARRVTRQVQDGEDAVAEVDRVAFVERAASRVVPTTAKAVRVEPLIWQRREQAARAARDRRRRSRQAGSAGKLRG